MNSDLKVLMNGTYVGWKDARVHISTHALHYGTAVFEGLRGYYNEDKGQIFVVRLMEHVNRMYRNMRVLRLEILLTKRQFAEAIVDVVRVNKFTEDIPGFPAAIPAHYHDHPVGTARSLAADAGYRRRFRTAPSPGHHDGGWADLQPDSDALYHPGDLPGL